MARYIVVIGNFARAYGDFASAQAAQDWASAADYTRLTDNGRMSTTILRVEDAPVFTYKVRLEAEVRDEDDGQDMEPQEATYSFKARSELHAEELAREQAVEDVRRANGDVGVTVTIISTSVVIA